MINRILLFLVLVTAMICANVDIAAALSEVEVNTTTLDFGTIADGKLLNVTVTNKFLRKVHLTFTVAAAPFIKTFSVTTGSLTLESLQSATVSVKALPVSGIGPKTADLKISGTVNTLTGDRPLNSSEEKTVTLLANVKELFDTDPNPAGLILQFGSVVAGQDHVQTLTLKANANLILSAFKAEPPFAADNMAGQTINAGSQRVVHVLLPASAPVGNHFVLLKILATAKSPFDPAHPQQEVRNFSLNATVTANNPDLSPGGVATPIIEPPLPGDTKSKISLHLSITNSGGASVACETSVFLDNGLEKTISVPAIDSGNTNIFDVSFRTGKTGQHTLKIQVDSNNLNNESNENNNELDGIIIQIP